MYGCESWTIKKTESQRIDAFELWCWRRLLRVPWTARRSNQSILKEISPGCSLEGWILKLKLQHSGHLMQRADLLEKTLMLGGIRGRRRRGRQRMRWLEWHHRLNGRGFGWTTGVGDGQGCLVCCDSWGHRVGHNWTTELSWTDDTGKLMVLPKPSSDLFPLPDSDILWATSASHSGPCPTLIHPTKHFFVWS